MCSHFLKYLQDKSIWWVQNVSVTISVGQCEHVYHAGIHPYTHTRSLIHSLSLSLSFVHLLSVCLDVMLYIYFIYKKEKYAV